MCVCMHVCLYVYASMNDCMLELVDFVFLKRSPFVPFCPLAKLKILGSATVGDDNKFHVLCEK